MKTYIKTISVLVAFGGLIAAIAGCSTTQVPALKGNIQTNSVTKVAPVKLVKNDPDHIFYLYPDGSAVSQVWTNASK